jgi:hypothetical protein
MFVILVSRWLIRLPSVVTLPTIAASLGPESTERVDVAGSLSSGLGGEHEVGQG